ncbi:MAG: TonB-dependent receptor plug domain-containing protein [Porticoccaceae bacterium]|nr:TonB-dependent receptor plug domain-containing protein [Porticoccaceae bacterium]
MALRLLNLRTPVATAMLITTVIAAPTAGAVSTESYLSAEIPQVYAVSGFQQQLEQAPASVTIIDRHQIELSGAQNFVDIFRLVPGFQSYHVSHNRYGISYHGVGHAFPNQMEVRVDGRSVYETIFSTVNWGTLGIELADIDHIEVVRGSNVPMQGSNAFMGSVNIVTRKPLQDSGLSLRGTTGALGTRNASLRYNDSLGPLNYRFSLGYQHSDGFPPQPEEGFLDDSRELFHANVRATYTPTLHDTVEFHLGYADDRADWYESSSPVPMSQSEFRSHHQAVSWAHSLDPANTVTINLYHNRLRARNLVSLGPLYSLLGLDRDTTAFLTAEQPPAPAAISLVTAMTGLDNTYAATLIGALDTDLLSGFGNLLSERYDLEARHAFTLSPMLRGAWGFGARRDRFESAHPFGFNTQVAESYWRLFGHGEWQATSWLTLNAGAMVENTFVGTLISPRVSANVALGGGHFLRLGHARSRRAPSLVEANEESIASVNGLIFNILRLSDPDLGEEKLTSTELAYQFQPAHLAMSLDLRLFDEKVTDVIDDLREPTLPPVSVFDSYLRRHENNGYWRFRGGEIQLSGQVTAKTFLRLHYTHTDMNSRMLRQRLPVPEFMDRNDRMARHSAGLLVGQELGEAFTLSLATYHQSRLRWEDGKAIDSFTRVDAQLAWRFTLGRTDGTVRLTAQNLGNSYAEFDPVNQFKTRVFLSAAVNLP